MLNRRVITGLLLLTGVVFSCGREEIRGDSCIVRSRAVASYATPLVVATPAIVTTALPAYGASYDATAAEYQKLRTALSLQESRIAALEKYRDQYQSRISILETRLGIPPGLPSGRLDPGRLDPGIPPSPRAIPGDKTEYQSSVAKTAHPAPAATDSGVSSIPSVVTRSCIQCHGADKPKGDFSIVDASGKLVSLNAETRLEILRRINLPETDPNVMPPKGKGTVSDKEAAELLDALTRPSVKGK